MECREEAEAQKRIKMEEEKALQGAVQALAMQHMQEEEEVLARQRHEDMIQSVGLECAQYRSGE